MGGRSEDELYDPEVWRRRLALPKRVYGYVGPQEIRDRCGPHPRGYGVGRRTDIDAWARETLPSPVGELYPATFVVDEGCRLLIADRGCEHVACAGGKPVRSAGEMFFRRGERGWEVAEVSNQSTGYCPEPESWPAVEYTLDLAGLGHPGGFTLAVVFRRCPNCGQRNVVKDGDFTCGVCGAALPAAWNFGEGRS